MIDEAAASAASAFSNQKATLAPPERARRNDQEIEIGFGPPSPRALEPKSTTLLHGEAGPQDIHGLDEGLAMVRIKMRSFQRRHETFPRTEPPASDKTASRGLLHGFQITSPITTVRENSDDDRITI